MESDSPLVARPAPAMRPSDLTASQEKDCKALKETGSLQIRQVKEAEILTIGATCLDGILLFGSHV